MTVWILAPNDINFSMAVGLIRLHMSSNLVRNKGQRVSPYSPSQSILWKIPQIIAVKKFFDSL